ncbi:hypothetical protein SmJEL517_g05029 [Synchytrium microbalum]|uniref:SMP-LTD domain-containing protein n=1 Tax=Synchytrium microbalum TaxID=1806994 RepID=A0A507BX75_9FUNG|nr:uncharacterized protein SmJEL517_g05029 [Synchytrium microbalum]TPX31738.1 hypothetical protein SmJEL517_g05029 [Synchytrium microbalum]
MFLYEYIRALLLGAGLFFVVEVILIIRLLQNIKTSQPNLVAASQDAKKHRDAWPPQIVEFLQNSLAPAESDSNNAVSKTPSQSSVLPPAPPQVTTTEQCHWLNVLIHRWFLELRVSEVFMNKMKIKLVEKINYKLQSSNFVSHIAMTDISLGDNPPKIHGIRLLKGITEDLVVIAELDVTYPGGASVGIDCVLTAGFNIPVRVHVSGFAGKLRARIPSVKYQDSVGVSFVEDPGVTFTVESPITVGGIESIKSLVNSLLARLIKNQFIEFWILPKWHNVYLPMMMPAPDVVLQRMGITIPKSDKPDKDTRPATPSTTPTTASVPTANRPSALSALRGRNWSNSTPHGDILAGKAFPHSTIVPDDIAGVETLETGLLNSFLTLARESDRTVPQTATTTPPEKTSDTASIESTQGQPTTPTAMEIGEWKTVRQTKHEIKIQKKRVVVDGKLCEVSRGLIRIACDPDRVHSILSNPEHNRHVDEAYAGSNVLRQFDEKRLVRQISYNLNRNGQPREYLVLEIKKHLHDSNSSVSKASNSPNSLKNVTTHEECFVIVSRSVAGVRDGGDIKELIAQPSEQTLSDPAMDPPITSSPSSESILSSSPSTHSIGKELHMSPEVHLFGYMVLPVATDQSACDVVILSNMAPDLSRLEINYNSCRRMKTFIEDLAKLSNMSSVDQSSSRSGKTGDTDGSTTRKIEKLKGYVSAAGLAAGSYLAKNKKVSSWLGLPAGSSSSSGVSATGGGNGVGRPSTSSGDEMEAQETEEDGEELAETIADASPVKEDEESGAASDSELMFGSIDDTKSIKSVQSSVIPPSLLPSSSSTPPPFLLPTTTATATVPSAISSSTIAEASDPKAGSSSPLVPAPPLPFRPNEEASFEERVLIPKDPIYLETIFDASRHSASSIYSFEIRSPVEGVLSISISFRPTLDETEKRNGEVRGYAVLPESDGQRWLLPTTSVNIGPGRNASGNVCVAGFSSGIFVLTIENTSSKKTTRDIECRTSIVDTALKLELDVLTEWSLEPSVARKSRLAIPVIYTAEIEGNAHLQWTFSTFGLDVVFGILYQPLIDQKPKTWEQKLALRGSVSSVTSTANSDDDKVLEEEKPPIASDEAIVNSPTSYRNEVIVALIKVNSKSSSISGSLPIEKYGIYSFVFENSAVISPRAVSLKASLLRM